MRTAPALRLMEAIDDLFSTNHAYEIVQYQGRTYRVPLKEWVRLENLEEVAVDQVCTVKMFMSHHSSNPCRCRLFDEKKWQCGYSGEVTRQSERQGIIQTHHQCVREDDLARLLIRKGMLEKHETARSYIASPVLT